MDNLLLSRTLTTSEQSGIEKNTLKLEKNRREHTCARILAHFLLNAVS